jgi:hypothetical protein
MSGMPNQETYAFISGYFSEVLESLLFYILINCAVNLAALLPSEFISPKHRCMHNVNLGVVTPPRMLNAVR